MSRTHAAACLRIGLILIFWTVVSGQNWPQWRGPEADGVSRETGIPVRWGPGQNIEWKVKLAGRGMSTPIVWDDRIFVTSQIGFGRVDPGSARYTGPVPDEDGPVTLVLQCFRREDGSLLWEYRVAARPPLPSVHAFHNLATPSPVTDGERVYVWFGTGQLAALSLDGRIVWERHIGNEYSPFELLWGHGSSPVLFKNRLILFCDHEPAAYLLALDCRTGEEVWRTDRGKGLRSYSTPYLVGIGDRQELVVNSNPRIDAYDPETGRALWHAGGENRVPIGMPVSADGILYATRGYNSGPYFAIRPGGKGDVSGSHVLWEVPTGAPYVSSFLFYQGLLFMANEVGVVRCIDPKSGDTVWSERVGGNFSASPIGAEGRVYFLSEEGETVVIQAGREFVLVARNPLNELCRASPVAVQGRILIRADHHLYSIGAVQGPRPPGNETRQEF